MLPGAEGAHLYQVRPSFEDLRDLNDPNKEVTWFAKFFAFNKRFKAIIQVGNGQEHYEGDNSNREIAGDDGGAKQMEETD